LFFVKIIADKIEKYIKSKGIAYYEDMDKRYLNSIDILIFSAYTLIKHVFETFIYKTSESPYQYTESFIFNFQRILNKEKNMKNEFKKLKDSKDFKSSEKT